MNMTLTLPDIQNKSHAVVVWTHPLLEKRPRMASFLAALAFHAIMFLIGGFVFMKAPEYGIDKSQGGISVFLVAAPDVSAAEQVSQPVITAKNAEMEMAVPKPAAKAEEKKLVNTAKESEKRGDGSSAQAGENSTTFSSAGTGEVDQRPGYLKNPPPHYPSEAVALGQEGVVKLSVVISRDGRAKAVKILETSGFPLLDESALKAVKKWKFSPGRAGALAMESEAVIPVRFRLEDLR